MEPADFCKLALTRLQDWVSGQADEVAVAVLLSHFARSRPTEPLFLESLRALARDRANGSMAAAALAIRQEWLAARRHAEAEHEPLRLRPEDRPAGETGASRGRPRAGPEARAQPETGPTPAVPPRRWERPR